MDWAFSYGESSITEEALNNVNSGSCRLCGLMTSQHCKRCGDYYCSEKCQHVDWPKHRYICFPMPPLVRIRNPVNDDDIYPVKPPGTSENCLIELRAMVETIMKKLQRMENNLGNKNIGMMNGVKTPLKETRDLQQNVIDEPPPVLESTLNGPEDSKIHVQVNNSHDVETVTNGSQASETPQISDSRSSLSNSQIIPSETSTTLTDHVVLCTFRSTNRCAIRSKSTAVESAFRAVTEKIDLYGRTAPPMETLPKVGAYAITMRSNKHYSRVKIQSVMNENKIRVVFCDYGNTVCRKLPDLRMISEEISSLPQYVVTVQLYGVQMTKYSEKIIEFLKSLERKQYKAKYIKENGNTHVELYDIENNQLLNEVLTKFCSENNDDFSKAGSVHQQPSPTVKSVKDTPKVPKAESNTESGTKSRDENNLEQAITPPFQNHIFTTDMCDVAAVIVDVDLIEFGYMACIQQKDLGQLSKIQTLLNTMEFDDKPYEPKLNEYCIAKFENEWYRGLVVSVLDGTFEISYTDFLNEAILTSDCIRPYPKNLKIDCYTTLCKIDGLPKKLTNKQREFLKSEMKINDVILINRVIQIFEEKIALIECNDITARMHDQNLI